MSQQSTKNTKMKRKKLKILKKKAEKGRVRHFSVILKGLATKNDFIKTVALLGKNTNKC